MENINRLCGIYPRYALSIVLVVVLFCLSPYSFASVAESKNIDLRSKDVVSNTEQSMRISGELILNRLIELQAENENIKKQNEELHNKLNAAISSINENNTKNYNDDLKNEISKLKEKQRTPSWVEWVGILLACVAAIVTTFGVFVALFSFYGYKKIIDETKRIAEEKTETTIPDVLPNYTRNALIELIENGSFNDVIKDAVLKVTFRGIEFDNDEVQDV